MRKGSKYATSLRPTGRSASSPSRYEHPSVPQHGRGIVQRPKRTFGRGRPIVGNLSPGAVAIVSESVGGQLPPVLRSELLSIFLLSQHFPVGEQQHRANPEVRLVIEGSPCSGHSLFLLAGRVTSRTIPLHLTAARIR